MPLTTNWRANTGVFISQKDGNNATGNGSQGLPYRDLTYNLPSGINGVYNLRGTYYNNGNIPVTVSNAFIQLNADGQVIIDGSGFSEVIELDLNDFLTSRGILWMNAIQQSNRSTTSRGGQNAFDCIMKGGAYDYQRGSRNSPFVDTRISERVLCINQTIRVYRSNVASNFTLFRHTFDKDSTLLSSNTNSIVTSCAFEQGATFNARTGDQCNNCAFGADGVSQATIEGVNIKDITLDGDGDTIGNTYTDGEKFSGVATLIGGTATVTFSDCFYTADLGFNNPDDEDYTLRNDSILINNLAIIGCYTVATRFDASHPAFDPLNSGVSYTNVTRNLIDNTFDLDGGFVEGEVVSTDDPTQCIELPFATTLREAVLWFGTFLYNQGEWIDKENYNSGINDEVRLTLEFQFYDENEPNGANSPLNFSGWISFEVQQAIEVDDSGLGNGNVDADLMDLDAVTAKRLRVRFVQRTNGV